MNLYKLWGKSVYWPVKMTAESVSNKYKIQKKTHKNQKQKIQWVITNKIKTNFKNSKYQQINTRYKKYLNGNFSTNKYNTQNF